MVDFKNSIWLLIESRTLSYEISIDDLTVNSSQWNYIYIQVALEQYLDSNYETTCYKGDNWLFSRWTYLTTEL